MPFKIAMPESAMKPMPASRPRVQQFDRTGKPLTDRGGRRRVRRYYAPTYDHWKQETALHIERIKRELKSRAIPKKQAIGIELLFYFRPVRKPLADQWCPADVGDIDNLQKAIFDAIQGAFIEDDCAICLSFCQKLYASWAGEKSRERIEITVSPLRARAL